MVCFIFHIRVITNPHELKVVFTTRHFPSAIYAMACVHVRLSQVGVVSKRMNESSWVLGAWELPFSYPALSYKEIRADLPPIMRVTFVWNFAPKSKLRKFRRCKSIALSTKLVVVVVVDGRVC